MIVPLVRNNAGVPCACLVSAVELTVGLDYGQFYLHTADNDPDLAVAVLERAMGGDGIAQHDTLVVIQSPHQSNFAMALTVEVWDGPPEDDAGEWEEAFEVHLDVATFGLVYESPTIEPTPLPVSPGAYHAVITGRGFIAAGWPGSTEPGDVWRIRLWPSTGPEVARRLRGFSAPPVRHPEPVFRDAGVASVRRIRHALDALNQPARLSGSRATVTVQRVLPGTRRQLYKSLANPCGWLTSTAGPGTDVFYLLAGDYDREEWGDADRIVPAGGQVVCAALDRESPRYATWSWTWAHGYGPISDLSAPGTGTAPLLPPDPVITWRVDLDTAAPDGEVTRTLVTVTHDNVPAEWADDLTAYWAWALERADYDFDLSHARAHGYHR